METWTAENMGMAPPTIGIDFGTTTSSMAWVDPATGKAEILKNAEGEEKTPSVVYFGDDGPVVGSPAELMLEDEEERRRVVTSIKRELVNAPTLALPGRRVKAIEVAAAVLAKLKRDAEELYFQQPVTRAVVTCPAAFYAMERDEIARAARLAGFEEVELLDEPVAAALAYSRGGQAVGQHVLVYDLGGGTFDLALLRESEDGFELAMEPKGLRRCGGDDFDEALYDWCDAEAMRQWGAPLDATGRNLRFLRDCRKRKENLSAHDKVLFSSVAGAGRLFRHSLTRADFEGLISEQIATTVRLTQELVRTAGDQGCAVETVVLIGGSSRIPLIQRQLAEALPVAPRKYGDADVAVALGAAYAAQDRRIPRPDPLPEPNPNAVPKLPKQVLSDHTVAVGILDVAALDLAFIESLVESIIRVANPDEVADFRKGLDEFNRIALDIMATFLGAGGTHLVYAILWSGDAPEAAPVPHVLLRFESGIADPGAIECMKRLRELDEELNLKKITAIPLDRHWYAISQEGSLSGDGNGPVAKALDELEPRPINLVGYLPDLLKEKAVAEVTEEAAADSIAQMLVPLTVPFRALSSANLTLLGAGNEVTIRLVLTFPDAQTARDGAEVLTDLQFKARAMLALESANPQADHAAAMKVIADVCADVRIGFEANRIFVEIPWRVVTDVVGAFNPQAETPTASAPAGQGEAPSVARPGRVPGVQDLHGKPAEVVQRLQRETAEALGLPVIFRHQLKYGGEGPEVVVIPPGRFMMGSSESEPERFSNEGPQHAVTLAQPFAIGRYAVTFEEYDRFCAQTGRAQPGDGGWGRGRRPVINVSWDDAVAYCVWLSQQTGRTYRLPSEAEWEYAARAGTSTAYWWGNGIDPSLANYDPPSGWLGAIFGSSSARKQTLPVDSFRPNPFGLYQVHGNVWEWCRDCWHESYEGAPTDGSAWESGSDTSRVVRGGAWFFNPRRCRAAYRFRSSAVARFDLLGFRVCCVAPIE